MISLFSQLVQQIWQWASIIFCSVFDDTVLTIGLVIIDSWMIVQTLSWRKSSVLPIKQPSYCSHFPPSHVSLTTNSTCYVLAQPWYSLKIVSENKLLWQFIFCSVANNVIFVSWEAILSKAPTMVYTMKIPRKTHIPQDFLWNIRIFHRKSGGIWQSKSITTDPQENSTFIHDSHYTKWKTNHKPKTKDQPKIKQKTKNKRPTKTPKTKICSLS